LFSSSLTTQRALYIEYDKREADPVTKRMRNTGGDSQKLSALNLKANLAQ